MPFSETSVLQSSNYKDPLRKLVPNSGIEKSYRSSIGSSLKKVVARERANSSGVKSEPSSDEEPCLTDPETDADDDTLSGNKDLKKETLDSEKGDGPKKTYSQNNRDKKKQNALTLQWLEENYCLCEGVCLPRSVLYTHYVDFCRKESLEPACPATFGKTFRQKFPLVTTRRLGTRGRSKYNYYGIGIRETSQYYSVYSSKGLTRFSDSTRKKEGGYTHSFDLSQKTGTLLPAFPDAKYLILPENLPTKEVDTFLVMYKTHCQCLLDSAIGASFKEIENFLLHFWQGLPDHMSCVVNSDMIADIICTCDSIFYKTLMDVLIPSTMQEMSETLLRDIHSFADSWEKWVSTSLENLPQHLIEKKRPVARRFASSLRRHISFLHLAQTSRPVLFDADKVNQMISDMDRIDLESIGSHALCPTATDTAKRELMSPGATTVGVESDLVIVMLKEFKELLRKQATIEAFIEWLDSNMEQKIIKPSKQNGKNFQKRAQDFLLKWAFLGGRISNYLTLNNAKSFASIHLIRLLLDEYMLLAIESQIHQEKDKELETLLEKYTRPDELGRRPFISRTPQSSFVATIQSPTNKSPSDYHYHKSEYYDPTRPLPLTYPGMNGDSSYPAPSHLGRLEKTVTGGMITPPMSPMNSLHPSLGGSTPSFLPSAPGYPYIAGQYDSSYASSNGNCFGYPSYNSSLRGDSYYGPCRQDMDSYATYRDPYSSEYNSSAFSQFPGPYPGSSSAFGNCSGSYSSDYYSNYPSTKPLVEHVPVIQPTVPHSSGRYHHGDSTNPMSSLTKDHGSSNAGSGPGIYGNGSPASQSPAQSGGATSHQHMNNGDLVNMTSYGMMPSSEQDMTSAYPDMMSQVPGLSTGYIVG